MKKVIVKSIILGVFICTSADFVFAELNTSSIDAIAGDTVHCVFFYDTTQDEDSSWRTDNTKSWYNEPSNPSDNFYGTTLDNNRWTGYENDGGTYDVNYEVTLNTNGTKSGSICGIYSEGKWSLSGDFDIQVDFENFSGSGTDGGFHLSAYIDENNVAYVRRQIGNRYARDVKISGTWLDYQYATTTDTSGKLRVTRSADTIHTYYWNWNDTLWTEIGTGCSGFPTDSLFVSFDIWVSNASCSVDFDNFIINSGSTSFGQYGSADRSPTRAFPERALLVCHNKGLDILDASDNSMWMRFDKTGCIATQADHQSLVADVVHKVSAGDGHIVLSASSGLMAGLCILDFSQDRAWFYGEGTNCWDYNSNVANRNFIRGWTQNTDYASLLDNNVNDFSIGVVEENVYIAAATVGGVTVINPETNIKNDDAGGSATAIRIGQDGALYYNDGSTFYKDYTSWRPGAVNGTFTGDESTTISNIQTMETTPYHLFIGTSSGVSKRSVDSIAVELINYNTGNGLLGRTSNNVRDIEIIPGGTMWVGTGGTGGCVSVLDAVNDSLRGYFSAHPDSGNLASNDIISLSYGTASEHLIVATSEGADHLSGDTGDITLPVELSSFTAQFVNNVPTLCWTTATETDNLGWNVYRAETDNFTQSIKINPDMIEGAGTSSQLTEYSFQDEYDIVANTTYWYWLESIDYSGLTDIYGPVSLTIPEEYNDNTPDIPKWYGLAQNYPNPFNPYTEIMFNLDKDCYGELSIYNVKGEKVITLFEGFIEKDRPVSIIWDGKDESGKESGSGIYFYRLKTDSEVHLKKMIMLK